MMGDRRSELLMDKRILLPKVGNACRSLFGPVDHAEVKKTLQREMRIWNERNREKWNFDFVNERPLPGRYLWEETTDDQDVPEAYQMPRLTVNMKLFAMSAAAAPSQEAHAATAAAGDGGVAAAAPESERKEAVLTVDTGVSSLQSTTPTPNAETTPRPASTSTATQTSPRKRKHSQAQITDFFPKRKVSRTEAKPRQAP